MALTKAWQRPFYALATLFFLAMVAVFGFHYLEGFSFLQALWFVMATITTVGYGDVVPATVPGRLLALALMFGGVGLFTYAALTTIVELVEGTLGNAWIRRALMKKIGHLQDHIIVCGAGRVGNAVIGRLTLTGHSFVVIERLPAKAETLANEGILVLNRDASEDESLRQAGIMRARGLVTCLPDDADNVFVVLTAKGLNPDLQVVARSNRPESEDKLKRAGADKVISPASIGGRRMAASILKPFSVDVIETMVEKGLEIDIEELTIFPHSPLVGKSLRDSGIKKDLGAYILAVKRRNQLLQNPGADTALEAGDLLVAVGTPEELSRLEAVASAAAPTP